MKTFSGQRTKNKRSKKKTKSQIRPGGSRRTKMEMAREEITAALLTLAGDLFTLGLTKGHPGRR